MRNKIDSVRAKSKNMPITMIFIRLFNSPGAADHDNQHRQRMPSMPDEPAIS
jgi:hypothetical protein